MTKRLTEMLAEVLAKSQTDEGRQAAAQREQHPARHHRAPARPAAGLRSRGSCEPQQEHVDFAGDPQPTPHRHARGAGRRWHGPRRARAGVPWAGGRGGERLPVHALCAVGGARSGDYAPRDRGRGGSCAGVRHLRRRHRRGQRAGTPARDDRGHDPRHGAQPSTEKLKRAPPRTTWETGSSASVTRAGASTR